MDKRYNLYNLEASFEQFLVAGIDKPRINSAPVTSNKNNKDKAEKKSLKNVSIKNYLSDLRHFWGWLIFYLKAHNKNINFNSFQGLIEILKQVQHDTIEKYKTYLIENNIPVKTINRRLSTLRKFFSFCIYQGWLRENPAKKIENLKIEIKNDDWELQKKSILNQFQSDLLKENMAQNTVISFLNDIEEFLNSV